jgi:hypothetical protein
MPAGAVLQRHNLVGNVGINQRLGAYDVAYMPQLTITTVLGDGTILA